ncbi:MAG: glycosyltransferase family 4 protein [Eggerthellaceae bacterium]
MSSRSLRVLVVGPSMDAQGGIATVIRQHFECGLDKDLKLSCLVTTRGGSRVDKLICAIGAYLRFPMLAVTADIVHIHSALRGSFVRKYPLFLLSKLLRKKVVLHIHEGEFKEVFDKSSETEKKRIRKALALSDRVVVLSSEWAECFENFFGIKDNVVVIPNAVPTGVGAIRDYEARNILFLGKLCDRKSPDVLLKAISQVRFPINDLVVHFVGNGDIAKYEALAAEIGVSDRCCFHGWKKGKDLEKIVLDCSIFCLPSKNEGMPMSLLEAMSRGLVPISTRVGGVPSVIKDGVNGCLIDVGDVDGLSACLDSLLNDSELRKRLGRLARNTIVEDYSMENQKKLVRNLYFGICNQR